MDYAILSMIVLIVLVIEVSMFIDIRKHFKKSLIIKEPKKKSKSNLSKFKNFAK
ncbi:hypothetical protein PV797_21205 [Clostridiaceae bacterium M8S5]|nr:hypothetical protein PV797_21205 [Clostridiaceae bacterium M8S5]